MNEEEGIKEIVIFVLDKLRQKGQGIEGIEERVRSLRGSQRDVRGKWGRIGTPNTPFLKQDRNEYDGLGLQFLYEI